MAQSAYWLSCALACYCVALPACSASDGDPSGNAGSGNAGSGNAGNGGSGNGSGSGANGGAGGSGAALGLDSGVGGTLPEEGQVFGHSPKTLYELEPFSKAVTVIGNFDCLGSAEMWDIAVNATGAMVGVASTGLGGGLMVNVDPATAHCDQITTGVFPNSLTFVPVGILDPSKEVLVGYNQSTYVRIDPLSGVSTNIGSLNPNSTGTNWQSSGDIVSLEAGGTYLTARPVLSSSDHPNDALIEVDPATGKAIRVIGLTGFPQLWGLGFWAGTAYGFSATGTLISIDLTTGAGTTIPILNVPSGLSFWGAGTTTSAPIEPPH